MNRLARRRLFAACCVLAAGLEYSVDAQIAPRLTGLVVIAQLQTAQQDLTRRAVASPDPKLDMANRKLGALADRLRQSMGSDAARPLDTLGASAKGNAYRAYAAAQRTEAYLAASGGCLGGDAQAMTDALVTNIDALASGSDASKQQPVINALETLDHRPLFVLRDDAKGAAFALVGDNLFDAQCENPQIILSDVRGDRKLPQPTVTGMLPNRIELSLPATASLPPGGYVLHLLTKRKAFLVGCTKQPEAVAAIQIAPVVKMSVSYEVVATCRAAGTKGAEHVMPPITGVLPDLASDSTSAQHIDVTGCPEPLRYSVSAKVAFSDGHSASVGPITQGASAGITAGLPGGLSLSWDPSVQQLFVRSGSNSCKGVY